MTDAIYSRAASREILIWPSFVYSGPFKANMITNRVVIFGLYSAGFQHGHGYLKELAAEDLLQLTDTYDLSMAALDAEDQALILDIVAKRYVNNIDRLLKEAQLITKEKEIDVLTNEITARIDAINVDRAELETKRAQIEIAMDKAAMTVREIETQIILERVAQQYVALDIKKQELAQAKANLAILAAGLKGLNIQLNIIETGIEMVDVDVRQAQLLADIASIKARISEKTLTEKQLEIDEAELDALIYELENVKDSTIELIEAGGDTITTRKTGVEQLEDAEFAVDGMQTARLNEQTARTDGQKQSADIRQSTAENQRDINIVDDTLAIKLATEKKVAVIGEDGTAQKKTEVPSVRSYAARKARDAALDAAEMYATADITNTLTHTIGNV